MPAAAVRYTLFDLLTLALDLVAPILDPLFGGPDDADEPEPPPSADPLVVTAGVEAEFSAIEPSAECGATFGVAPVTPDVAAPVTTAEPLYVRRGTGRGARYDVAGPDATGQRYRREVVGKRRRFTPVEARR